MTDIPLFFMYLEFLDTLLCQWFDVFLKAFLLNNMVEGDMMLLRFLVWVREKEEKNLKGLRKNMPRKRILSLI